MYSVLRREIFFAKGHLSNGDRIRLAAFLLDGCTPAPCTKLGELFDKCVKGLHLLIETYDHFEQNSPFRDLGESVRKKK